MLYPKRVRSKDRTRPSSLRCREKADRSAGCPANACRSSPRRCGPGLLPGSRPPDVAAAPPAERGTLHAPRVRLSCAASCDAWAEYSFHPRWFARELSRNGVDDLSLNAYISASRVVGLIPRVDVWAYVLLQQQVGPGEIRSLNWLPDSRFQGRHLYPLRETGWRLFLCHRLHFVGAP